jgi:outer membrane protein OmpA-like peptidoglycan-associated protein
MKQMIAVILAILLAAPAAFAQSVDEHARTKKGAIIGGIAGGIVGAVIGNNHGKHSATRGAVVGTVVGTATGAIVGAYIDKQERELRQINGVEVQRTANDELNVIVKNDVLFDFDSSRLRTSSRDSLREMAQIFEKYPATSLSVQGYTDSVGSESYNNRLSGRRASSVASYIEQLGVDGGRVGTHAYGESNPRASNSTASGRQLNRRVEIKVKANREA